MKKIFFSLILLVVVLLLIGCSSNSSPKKEVQSHYKQINFDNIIKEDFLNSVDIGENIVLGDKALIRTSFYEQYKYLFWANGPTDNPLGEGSDFVSIEVNDFANSGSAIEKFETTYENLIVNQENLLNKPTVVDAYSDKKLYRVLYDTHYEESPFFNGEYEAIYTFAYDNIYVVVSGKFANNEEKDKKNEIVVNIGEKIRTAIGSELSVQ